MSHARLGRLAVWTCKGCTTNWYQGRFPCTECCGYTTCADKVVRGVLTIKGRPNARCLP